DLLADREQQLDVDRGALLVHVARQREQHGHRRLVVGAEDAFVGVLPERVLADLEPQCLQLAPDALPALPLAQRGARDRAQLSEDRVQVAVLQCRSGRRGGGRHDRPAASAASAVSAAPADAARLSSTRTKRSCSPPPRCASAAATKSRNSGAGRSGRDLNSGWNCEATKNGWSWSSMISTRRSSGDVPETTR